MSNVLFLHWDRKDTNISSLQYLRDEGLKRQMKVVVFIQNQHIKGLRWKEEQNEAGKGYLEIEHPDFTQTPIREVLEQEMHRAVT